MFPLFYVFPVFQQSNLKYESINNYKSNSLAVIILSPISHVILNVLLCSQSSQNRLTILLRQSAKQRLPCHYLHSKVYDIPLGNEVVKR